jgi:hypothetical protein
MIVPVEQALFLIQQMPFQSLPLAIEEIANMIY